MRRVAVQFVAELASFKRNMRGGADEVRKVKQEAVAAQREVAGLGEAGEKAGRQLGDGIVRGADGKLRDARGRFVKAGQESGRGFGDAMAGEASVSLVQRLGPLVAKMPLGPAAAAAGGVLGAAMAPTLSAAVAGAVVGGAGVGGVLGGVAIAARDPQVKAAGSALGGFILGDLEDRASGFVPPVLEGIADIRAGWQEMGPDLDRVFESSRFVDPLVKGAISGGQKFVAGFGDAIDNADPAADAFGRLFDQMGESIGGALSSMAEDADEGAAAIDDLTMAVSRFVDTTAAIVHAGAVVKGWTGEVDKAIDRGRFWLEDWVSSGGAMEHFGWQLDLTADGFAAGSKEALAYRDATTGVADATDFATLKAAGMTDAWIASKDASGTYRQQLDEVNNELGNTPAKVEDAIGALEDWRAALDEMTGKNLDARQAQRDLEAAIDDASAAVIKNGETAINHGTALDINSAKGRANADALDKIAAEANDAYAAIMDQTGSQDLANAAAERGRAKFIELAGKMGLSESAATALADELIRIKDRRVTVTADTGPAWESAKALKARIDNMHARINVSAEPSGGYGGSAHTGDGYSTGQRWGGVYEHAQRGLINLRQANVYSAVTPARYAFAEAATGGEAFIPKRGNPDRSISIGRRAMEWYGMAVVPKSVIAGGWATSIAPTASPAAAPVGGEPQVLEAHIEIGGEVVRVVRTELRDHDRDLARRADMLRR